MLLYSTGKSTTSIAFIAKEDNYQIGNWFSKNTIYTGMWKGYTFKIYQYGNEDYYILVSGFSDDAKNFVIKDVYDSVFIDTLNDTDVNDYIRYVAYVPNLKTSNYSIAINGIDINLEISERGTQATVRENQGTVSRGQGRGQGTVYVKNNFGQNSN